MNEKPLKQKHVLQTSDQESAIKMVQPSHLFRCGCDRATRHLGNLRGRGGARTGFRSHGGGRRRGEILGHGWVHLWGALGKQKTQRRRPTSARRHSSTLPVTCCVLQNPPPNPSLTLCGVWMGDKASRSAMGNSMPFLFSSS